MKILKNVFLSESENAGDYCSSPLLYFNFPGYRASFMTVSNPRWWDDPADVFIIGGGGVLHSNAAAHIRSLLEKRDTHFRGDDYPKAKVILWGAGTNIHGVKKGTFARDTLDRLNLVGVRDWGSGYHWVPCASCMHHAFDSVPGPNHDVVVYDHHQSPVPVDGFPRMSNHGARIGEVVRFLASGRLVLTSSYHGVYWSQLIGRRVIAYPFSSKFHHLRHRPPMNVDRKPWINYARKTKAVPNYLEICREANVDFHRAVLREIR